ncbi:MAG: TorD/DmsD family molecular chaperone [Bacillota bacterium]
MSTANQLQLDRACLYTFFSRLFTDQTRAEDLEQYADFLAPVSGEYAGIGRDLQDYIAKWAAKDEADRLMRTEYARLFIVAGGVRPYESVYRGSEKLLMGEPWLEVKAVYRENSLVLEKPDMHPEDHASVELAFMAHLIECGGKVAEQKSFFEEHIYRWLPQVFNDLQENEKACFFKEMAVCGQNFMKQEKSLFASLDDEALTESDQRSDDRS